ncbi:hypothetical protein J2X97_002954 [Epilithonimonas hungarica]|uniref:hypothetical protein n=1 Tax=Epilithonimonas hungarica TaxID=454006 RepID=UPI0027877E9F|nr:hypothetical protein [Epilithonimonas hungarica]MDP9957288.1 hypothetical protein [Epilithonimonas hungarica]
MLYKKRIVLHKYLRTTLFLLLLINCKKKEDKSTNADYFKMVLNLKNYKIKTTKINDSITDIRGKSKRFEISGKLLNGKKISWWEVKEKKAGIRIKFQYVMITDNKNFLNQYIVYRNNHFLKLGSKFYISEISNGKISYIFNMPTKESAKISTSSFNYGFKRNNESLVHPRREKNAYFQDITIPPNAKRIKGYFIEGKEMTSKSVGLNTIYTLDSIK